MGHRDPVQVWFRRDGHAWNGTSGGQNRFNLEVQGNLVGDDRSAGLQRGVEVHAEIAPVDLPGSGESSPRAAHRIRPEAIELEGKRHALRDALERQVAVEDELATLDANASRAVGHRRVALDLEEVGRPDVPVALLIAGVDRGHVDLGTDRRAGRVRAGDQLAGEARELAAYLADHHVPDGEADLGVHRVDGPGPGDVAGDGGRDGGCGHWSLP